MTENNIDHVGMLEKIARKSATRPKVDSQGRPIGPPVTYEYDRRGNMIGPVPPGHAA